MPIEFDEREGKRCVDGIEEVDDDADRNDRSGGIRASLKVGSLRTNRRLGGFGYHLIRVGGQTRDWPNFLPPVPSPQSNGR